MRRSEITQELIELSRRAKELGFPQSVFNGDYFAVLSTRDGDNNTVAEIYKEPHIFMAHNMDGGRYYTYASPEECGSVFSENPFEDCVPDVWFLILEFSRCLEWLKKQFGLINLGTIEWGDWFVVDLYDRYNRTKKPIDSENHKAKTHHEAIAKAVVKILEGD